MTPNKQRAEEAAKLICDFLDPEVLTLGDVQEVASIIERALEKLYRELREPTEEMLDAGAGAFIEAKVAGPRHLGHTLKAAYKAMLAAAEADKEGKA